MPPLMPLTAVTSEVKPWIRHKHWLSRRKRALRPAMPRCRSMPLALFAGWRAKVHHRSSGCQLLCRRGGSRREGCHEFVNLALLPAYRTCRKLDPGGIAAFGNSLVPSRPRCREKTKNLWQSKDPIFGVCAQRCLHAAPCGDQDHTAWSEAAVTARHETAPIRGYEQGQRKICETEVLGTTSTYVPDTAASYSVLSRLALLRNIAVTAMKGKA